MRIYPLSEIKADIAQFFSPSRLGLKEKLAFNNTRDKNFSKLVSHPRLRRPAAAFLSAQPGT